MAESSFYKAILGALEEGKMCEPFTCDDVEKACPGLKGGLSRGFLDAHAIGNQEGNPELFEELEAGKFRCSRIGDYAI